MCSGPYLFDSEVAGFNDLVTSADIELDAVKRANLYSQAQKVLINEVPAIFLNNDVKSVLVKPYVKGVKQTPLDYIPGFYNLKELTVEP